MRCCCGEPHLVRSPYLVISTNSEHYICTFNSQNFEHSPSFSAYGGTASSLEWTEPSTTRPKSIQRFKLDFETELSLMRLHIPFVNPICKLCLRRERALRAGFSMIFCCGRFLEGIAPYFKIDLSFSPSILFIYKKKYLALAIWEYTARRGLI